MVTTVGDLLRKARALGVSVEEVIFLEEVCDVAHRKGENDVNK